VKIFCCLQWLVNMRLDACSKRKFKIRVLILPYLSLVITQNSFFLPNSNIPLSVFNSTYTITNSNITWEFSCKFVKKICKKRPFPAIFSKNFNWQVIPSWVIISYKIIKFASISYKICCEKCFIQNILQKNW